MIWALLFSSFFLSPGTSTAPPIVYHNETYVDYIRSVKFHPDRQELSMPIIHLHSGGSLILSFDDLSDTDTDYYYSIQHCQSDWTPSQLSPMEYIDGFEEEILWDYEFSFKTLTDYTHYEMALPNEDMRWTKSGNYILFVYSKDDNDQKNLIITRRFLVYESTISVEPSRLRTRVVGKSNTHQEFSFTVSHKNFLIRNPLAEIKAAVIQNGRWETEIGNLRPTSFLNDRMLFNSTNDIVFPAGKEFRFLDLRTVRARSEKIQAIRHYNTHIEVDLFPELSRAQKTYLYYQDLNGNFVIDHLDEPAPHVRSDYVDVFFSLDVEQPIFDSDVYILGDFSSWKPKEIYKMTYNDITSSYVAKVKLKQGYYDYVYALKEKDKPLDISYLEGDWYETENQYTVLIYYRPFGLRYDRLIAVHTFGFNNF